MINSLDRILAGVWIAPFRLWLDVDSGVQPTAQMLRGVLGRAIMDIDPYCYAAVFRPDPIDGVSTPRFLIRMAPVDPIVSPAIDYVLLGTGICHAETMWRCWDRACERGIGERGNFHSFGIRQIFQLGPNESIVPADRELNSWTLADAVWLADDQASLLPISMSFPSPLRLRGGPESKSSFIQNPTLVDVVVATIRRIRALHIEPFAVDWKELTNQSIAIAKSMKCTWRDGRQVDFVRPSKPQRTKLHYRCVTGSLCIESDPGPLWPLLTASTWLHIGKGTTNGLGQVVMV